MKFALILCAAAGASALLHPRSFFPSLFPVVPAIPGVSPAACSSSKPCLSGMQCRFRPGECGLANAFGTCVPAVDFCFFPGPAVCGCDGKTYESSCKAYSAGTNVKTFSPCDGVPVPITAAPKISFQPFHAVPTRAPAPFKRQTCNSDNDCQNSVGGPSVYCQFDECTAGAEGTCVNVPRDCVIGVPAPVCGCDGNTYQSQCLAARARVSIYQRGPCPAVPTAPATGIQPHIVSFPLIVSNGGGKPESCGGFAGGFCRDPRAKCVLSPGGCFGFDLPGVCVVPEALEDCGGPVCGCRGYTFENMCDLWNTGDQINHLGKCDASIPSSLPHVPPPHDISAPHVPYAAPLGSSSGPCEESDDCASNEVCFTDVGQCDEVGSCRKRPSGLSCLLAPEDPVCGCDGQTYKNECQMYAAGTSMAGRGECDLPTAPPGGDEGDGCEDSTQCPAGWFCDETATDCGRLPGSGSCMTTQTIKCNPNSGMPVCGCDGRQYKSECDAWINGNVGVTSSRSCFWRIDKFDRVVQGQVEAKRNGKVEG